jgi:hypothetical protein
VREHLEQSGARDVELKRGKSGQFDITIDGTLI